MPIELAPMDGMIGLAPDDPSNGPSFIATLFEDGVIPSKVFGLFIAPGSVANSEITIGGFDSTLMS